MRTHAIRISIPRLNPSQCREIINIHSRKLCRRNWWWIISAGNISMRVSRDNAQPTRELRGIKGLRVEACVAREPSYQHSSREYYSEVNHYSPYFNRFEKKLLALPAACPYESTYVNAITRVPRIRVYREYAGSPACNLLFL